MYRKAKACRIESLFVHPRGRDPDNRLGWALAKTLSDAEAVRSNLAPRWIDTGPFGFRWFFFYLRTKPTMADQLIGNELKAEIFGHFVCTVWICSVYSARS